MAAGAGFRTAVAVAVIAVIAFVILDPYHWSPIYGLDFDPVAVKPTPMPEPANDPGDRLTKAHLKYVGEIFGPESITFDSQGRGPYTGISDGRIVRRSEDDTHWEEFAYASPNRTKELCESRPRPNAPMILGINTTLLPNLPMEHVCGRPLGLRFHPVTGDLFFCDAYYGLFRVGKEGGKAELILDTVDGKKMLFANDLDIDAEDEQGVIYFTDTSSRHRRRDFFIVILEARADGRLMKHDLKTGETTVLVDELRFANGVALSKNKDFVAYCETVLLRCHKYWLKGPKAGTHEQLVNLPGIPDNIRLNPRGRFWVALHARRPKLPEPLSELPFVRQLMMRLPVSVKLWYTFFIGLPHGLVVEVDEDGRVTDVLEDRRGQVVRAVSEVEEHGGKLWFGSVILPQVAVMDYAPEGSDTVGTESK